MPLSSEKTALIAGIFSVSPDVVLRRLEMVLAGACQADESLQPVYRLAAAEVAQRRIVSALCEPILSNFDLTKPHPRRRPVTKLWGAVAAGDAEFEDAVGRAVREWRTDETQPPILDQACLQMADHCTDADLALLLRLTPVLRQVQIRLAGWTRNLSGENVAAIRLAFKDALAVSEDAGALFWETVYSMLPEPWQVIRLISAAIDRPSDRYLAASELASLGERLLDDVDGRISSLKHFDPSQGEAAGAAEAASVMVAVQELAEFEEWLTLKKDGPWGGRITEQKRGLALCMESRLRETEPAVAAVLPTQGGGRGGRGGRATPKLSADPEPLLVERATGLLTLMEEARAAAAAGGFGSLRAKTIEALEKRLEPYCDDLIEVLHKGETEEPERVRAYLDIAANFFSLIKGPQVAQIIRRRAAAA